MSLFDGQPLTPEDQERVRQNVLRGEGPTIRKQDGKGVWRTVRHKPWWMLVGKGPEGKTCGECKYLKWSGGARNKYFKCGRQSITSGTGTDIRKMDDACRLFEERLTPTKGARHE